VKRIRRHVSKRASAYGSVRGWKSIAFDAIVAAFPSARDPLMPAASFCSETAAPARLRATHRLATQAVEALERVTAQAAGQRTEVEFGRLRDRIASRARRGIEPVRLDATPPVG